MECSLCAMWERLPYAKKPTTPTNVSETESALALGYWLGKRDSQGRICERHATILRSAIEVFIEGKVIEQKVAPVQPTFVPGLQPFTNENSNRIEPPTPTIDLAAPYRNQNEPEITDPWRRIVETQERVAAEKAKKEQVSQLVGTAKPGTIEGALEAAKAPPTEGAKVDVICPLCGEVTVTGEVHCC